MPAKWHSSLSDTLIISFYLLTYLLTARHLHITCNSSKQQTVPRTTDAFVVRGWSDTQNADPGTDVDNNVRIRISEIERLLLTLLWAVRVVKIVALTPGAVSIDEMYSLNEAVQLVEFSQVEVHMLNENTTSLLITEYYCLLFSWSIFQEITQVRLSAP